MYPISTDTLALLNSNVKQTVIITCYGTEETITLTEADIIQGSFTIDRYCVSSDKIEIGSAIASELTLTLNNKDGRFDDYVFEGAEMYVRIGVKKPNAHKWENATTTYIPCGYFTVDKPPRKLNQINLTALDRMVMFDKDVNVSELTFPTTVAGLINQVCNICNVTLATTTSELVNYDYTISTAPDNENMTYRQMLMWIGEITGTCAYIDWDGKLRFEWYHSTSTAITPSERYSSDLYETPVQITGVQVVDVDDNDYLYGTEGYVLNIEVNPLIQSDYLSVATAVYSVVGGFEYLPYNCTTKPTPHVYPLDMIAYTDKNGNTHSTIVTNVTYRLNGNTKLAGKGETVSAASYATLNPLTKRESVIIQQMKKQTDDTITNRQQAVLNLNQMIVNSLGLRQTIIPAIDGTDIYYYHNAATLADSTIIYTFREGGFAWTDDWNDGEPVWQFGFTQDGNAVFNALSTYKIQSQFIDAGAITAEQLDTAYASIYELYAGAIEVSGDCIVDGTLSAGKLSVNEDGYAEIPKLYSNMISTSWIGWAPADDTSPLEIYSYYNIEMLAVEGGIRLQANALPIYLYGDVIIADMYGGNNSYATYNGYEIATLNDIPDLSAIENNISSLQGDVQSLWDEFINPGTGVWDVIAALEGRVAALEP